jgi:hypothetical protein
MVQKINHTCTKSKEIDSIKDKVDDLCSCVPTLEKEVCGIIKTLDGNGHKGLKEVVIVLSESVDRLSSQIEESKADRKDLRTSIGNLINYKSTLETTFSEKDKANSEREVRKVHLRWLIYITIILSLGIVSIYIDLRKQQKTVTTLETVIKMDEKK